MKKMFVISLVILFFISCSDNQVKVGEELIIKDQKYLEKLSANSVNKSYDYLSEIDVNVKINSIDKKFLNNEEFLKLNNNDIDIQTITLFYNGKLKGLGIYYYSKEEYNYYYRLYSINKETNKLLEMNTFITNQLRIKDVILANKVFFNGNKIDLFYYENAKEYIPKYDYSDLTLLLTNEINSSSSINEKRSRNLFKFYSRKNVDPNKPCGYVGRCPDGGASTCASPAFVCQEPPCGEKRLTAEANNLNYNYDNILIPNKYYSLRDNFLVNSNLGEKYLNIYYDTANHFNAALNPKVTVMLLKLFPDINSAIDRLNNSKSNEVIITTDLKIKILNIIKELKSNSSSVEYIKVLNQFIIDLETLSLKKRLDLMKL